MKSNQFIVASLFIFAFTVNFYDTAFAQGWIDNPSNGNQYQLIECGEWWNCENDAVSQGAHLVTINDANEQKWLVETFGADKLYWTGFTDENEEGNWVWVSGENASYTNWAGPEPNDLGGCEDYALMNCLYSGQGLWNDAGPCSIEWSSVTKAIIEKLSEVEYSEIYYPDFSSNVGLNWYGHSSIQDNNLIITPPESGCSSGSVWHTSKQFLQDGFETIFQFQITDLGGITDPLSENGGDGFAFVIQNNSSSSLGNVGGYIGYTGVANSLAIEFDTFYNDNTDILDPINNNHISVHTRGIEPNSSNHNESLGCVTDIPNMSDGNVYTVRIKYMPNDLDVFLNDIPVLNIPLNITTTLNLDNGFAWVGFTSGKCLSYEKHNILNWTFHQYIDDDEDGICDYEDNRPGNYNPQQEDSYPPQGNGCGDACECEGNFDGDDDCDGTDAFEFKPNFGRSPFQNPCESGNPCNGDFTCDGDVDGADAFTFKEDFGRSSFQNPCPDCVTVPWCVFP